jgi:hypothetical protein
VRAPVTPGALASGEGALVPGFERGAALLRDPGGKVWRLSWEEPEAAGADRRRALPAGSYELVGYRLIRADQAGVAWHVSATGPNGRAIEVAAGKEARLELNPTIRIGKRLQGKRLAVEVRGEEKMGLSIYRDGRRVPIAFRLLDERGREVDSGKIEYG